MQAFEAFDTFKDLGPRMAVGQVNAAPIARPLCRSSVDTTPHCHSLVLVFISGIRPPLAVRSTPPHARLAWAAGPTWCMDRRFFGEGGVLRVLQEAQRWGARVYSQGHGGTGSRVDTHTQTQASGGDAEIPARAWWRSLRS